MNENSLFEVLKREKHSVHTKGRATPIHFCLLFDAKGAYIEVRNEQEDLTETDYLQYNGALRSILKSIQNITSRSDFIIDWENSVNKVYLHENEFLIEPLLQTNLWRDEEGNTILRSGDIAILRLVLAKPSDGKKINSSLQLLQNDEVIPQFRFI